MHRSILRPILDGNIRLASGSEHRARVHALQRLLNRLMFSLKEDGTFGLKTERAVRVIQASRGLPVDGLVDETTLHAICAAVKSVYDDHPGEIKAISACADGLQSVPGIYREDRFPGCVALTFDDGPSPTQTRLILGILRRAKLTATFYVQGSCAAKWPSLVRETAQLGHRIGNHSWSHPEFISLDSNTAADQILRTQDLLRSIVGPAYTHTFRPPYGSPFHTSALPYSRLWTPIGDIIRNTGCCLMMWQTDTWDWKHFRAPEIVVEKFKRELTESQGGVVLMHDIHEQTVEALPGILDVIRQHRLRIVSDQDFLSQKYAQWEPLTRQKWSTAE